MTIEEMLDDIIKKEGGYVNHPADRGGETNYGITKKTYAEVFHRKVEDVTTGNMKALTPTIAKAIYKELYFDRPNLQLLPAAIQPMMLDMAVNHGARKAVEILQSALIGMGYSIGNIDGLLGQRTHTAVWRADNKRLIDRMIDLRIDFYKAIIAAHPEQKVFEKGWLARAESFSTEASA